MQTKLANSKDIIARLQELVVKEANAGVATGEPGKDTHYQSTEDKPIDKNKIGPEKNEPQKHEQHAQTDPSTPAKTAATKTAAELGAELLSIIEKAGTAGVATGEPGKDTHYQSTHDHPIDKNKIGPEKNEPQKHEQHAQTDPSTPVKAAADLDKIASYALGVSLAKLHMKQAEDQELAMYKEAGRREFEQMITKASQDLQQHQAQAAQTQQAQQEQYVKQASEVQLEKQAEDAGSAYFHQLLKQAQDEYSATQQQEQVAEILNQKFAALANEIVALKTAAADRDLAIQKQAEERKENEKWAATAEYITNSIFERLKNEVVKTNG